MRCITYQVGDLASKNSNPSIPKIMHILLHKFQKYHTDSCHYLGTLRNTNVKIKITTKEQI